MEGGQHAEPQSGRERDSDGQHHSAGIQGDRTHAIDVERDRGVHPAEHELGEWQANDDAEQRQERTLRQQLANHASPARAHGRADRQLALSSGGAREQQRRDVCAGDQQDEDDGRRQQCRHRVEDLGDEAQRLAQRHDADAAVLVAVRILGSETTGDRVELRLGLARSGVGREAGDDLESLVVAVVARLVERVGLPEESCVQWECEVGWHDAHDLVLMLVERDGLAEDVGVGAEARLPEAVAQHRNPRRARGVLAGRERATEDRLPPQQVEGVGRDGSDLQPLRLAELRHVGRRVVEQRDIRESRHL